MFHTCSLHLLMLVGAAVTSGNTFSGLAARPIDLQISEFYIDTPQKRDQDEYLEISGPPNTNFADATSEGQFTYYVLMLENVGEEAGRVDKIIKLSGTSLNEYGFAWFYGDGGEVYPAEDGYRYHGTSENSGCTLMLVAVPYGHGTPLETHDYDASSNGVARIGGDWDSNWIIVSSVGVVCNAADANCVGALYAPANFAPGEFTNIATVNNAVNTNTNIYQQGFRGAFDTIEYVGRDDDENWFAADLSVRGDGWSAGERNYRIASDEKHDGEPKCIDQDGQVSYNTFDNITVTQGKKAIGTCNCGGNTNSNVTLAENIEEPLVEPTLADVEPTLVEPAAD